MKTFTTIFSLFNLMILASCAYAQERHEITGHLGIGSNGLYRFESLDGSGGSEGGLSFSGGIRYGYTIGNRLQLISGLDYSDHHLTLVGAPMPEQVRQDIRISILSVPLHVQWNIGEWFFIHGGPDIDFQVNGDANMDNQSGVGFTIAVGARHAFGPWGLSVAPQVKNYALLAFKGDRYQQRLITGGASVGISYRF
ncbi:outer membrane beta-barrel protein [Parapedobacter sp. 10938]|uniref:outer membrane beta-barrel protein n=1 Tax=Parapedobacter flavus TaxID=3110225 RepID=UPI002DBA94F6|nr:outer membrane beta-barrel protein [Parapedobacter sp. 10938]MEC3878782.1 outer membrane beta-barrel protein [Parapedobacter sp. 10938]